MKLCACGCGIKVRLEKHAYLHGHHRRFKNPIEIFWSRVAIGNSDECWEWQGTRRTDSKYRYGLQWFDNRLQRAHRLAWQLTYGPIPDGLQICHHCDNPACCNPVHLFIGTSRDNRLDCVRKNRHSNFRKLSETDVKEIRREYSLGEISQYKLGSKYGVTRSCISLIVTRKRWRNI